MKPTMLVSGGDTPLGNSIVAKALAGFNVAATTAVPSTGDAGQNGGPRPSPGSALLLPWTPQSPISARNVVLQTIERFDVIDHLVVIHRPSTDTRRLHELPLATIQEISDVRLKSHLFLLREVIGHLLRRGSGLIALVVDRSGSGELATIDALVTEGFTTLANSLMTSYAGEPIAINGFETTSPNHDSCASFILTTLGAGGRPGRWFYFGERGGARRGALRSKAKR